MKTILLLRHAKSDWGADYDADHDRPLGKRGRRAADVVGRCLARCRQLPDVTITSSALRARDTVRRAAKAGGWDCPVETTDALYGASPEDVLGIVRELDDSLASVLLVGHEPTWSLLASGLLGGAEIKFPTAALARIDLAVEQWSETDFGRGTLIWFVTPKLLESIR